jgi:hypothetical protein
MRTMFDEGDREALLQRVASLTSASPRRWGKFTVESMLCHLCESTRMALGDLPVKPKGPRAFHAFPMKHLLLYVVPFPKGAPTAPELLAGTPGGFEADRTCLAGLLRRVATGPTEGIGPAHPLFGPLSRREWGAAVYKHTDHHLRQFGA